MALIWIKPEVVVEVVGASSLRALSWHAVHHTSSSHPSAYSLAACVSAYIAWYAFPLEIYCAATESHHTQTKATFDDSKEEKINFQQLGCSTLPTKQPPWWLSPSHGTVDLAGHQYFCLESSSILELGAEVRKWVIVGTRCGSQQGILRHGGVVVVGTLLLPAAHTEDSSLKTSQAGGATVHYWRKTHLMN